MGKSKSTGKLRKDFDYQEEGWEDFEKKKEWFNLYRKTHADESLANLKDAGIEQLRKMRDVKPEDFAVTGQATKTGYSLISQNKKGQSIKRIKNPAADKAIGFASDAVQVSISLKESPDSRITININKELAENVIVSTARVFRYEESSRSWVMIQRSGVAEDESFAWASIHRAGIYVCIGLPKNETVLKQLVKLYNLKPLLHAAQDKNKLKTTLNSILSESETEDFLKQIEKDPDFSDLFFKNPKVKGKSPLNFLGGNLPGLPPGGLPGFPGFPGKGFPEFDILDDICPPWRGGKFGDYLIPFEWPVFIWPFFLWGWRSFGPRNINGRIKSLVIHPTNGNILYAGAADGGVWKTTSGGDSWVPLWFQQQSMAIGSLSISKSNPLILYAATGEDTPGWGPSYPGAGIFRSADAGNTWLPTGAGPGNRCSKIIVHPSNPDIVYVASNSGLFQTTNGGTNWVQILTGHICDVVMNQSSPNIIYAARWNDRVYKSINSGATFTDTSAGIPIHIFGVTFWIGKLPTGTNAEWIKLAIGVNGANGGNFLLAKMGLNSGSVYKSTNGGTTWALQNGTHGAASYNEWTNLVAVNPVNENIIFAGAVGMERSTNGGTSFSGTAGTHSDHHVLVFDPNNANTCYVATDGGVYKSTNGGANWVLKSYRLIATQLYSIGVAQSGSFVLGSGTQDQGIIKSTGTVDWTDTGAGNEGGFFIVDPNNSNNIYTTPWSNDLRRSTNGGTAWTDIRSGMTETVGGTTHGPAQVYHIAVRPGNSNTLIAVGVINSNNSRKIYRSTNQGNSWSSAFTLPSAGYRIAFAPSNSFVCFVGCVDGRVYRSGTAGTSGSWAEPYTAANRPTTNAIAALAVGWNDPNLVYIGCGGFGGARVMRSTNGGATWANVSGVLPADQLPAMPVNALVIDQYNPDIVYVSNDIGVFRTQDGGTSWQDFSDGFLDNDVPRIIVSQLVLRKSNNTLYASTMGRGAYRRVL